MFRKDVGGESNMVRKWLIEIRKEAGLTHEEIANSVGIKRQYYSKIENGTRRPSVQVAKKIAELLQFDWTIFFDSQGNEVFHNHAKITTA